MFLTADKFILAQNAKSSNKVIPFSENVSPKKNLCTRGMHWQMRYCKIFQQTCVILSLNVQKQLWKVMSFSEKDFFLEKTIYTCEMQLRILCQKYTGRCLGCLRSIFQANKRTHTLLQKDFLRLVLRIRGRHFRQSCAKFLLTKS